MLSGLMGRSHETGSYCACPRLPVNLSILFWPLVSSHMPYSLFFLDVYFIFLLICRRDISVCMNMHAHVCAFPYSSWMQSWLSMLLFKDMSLFILVFQWIQLFNFYVILISLTLLLSIVFMLILFACCVLDLILLKMTSFKHFLSCYSSKFSCFCWSEMASFTCTVGCCHGQ